MDTSSHSNELELPSNHPGRDDQGYIRRRKMFFHLARDLRIRKLGVPSVPYTNEERNLWSSIYSKLLLTQDECACSLFLEGRRLLNLRADTIPELPEIDEKLRTSTGFRVVPAEGLIEGSEYFGHWANGEMPCTQFLRHESHPEYTPEPDMVHDIAGHVPPLMIQRYADLIKCFGAHSIGASPERIQALVRFYWFTVEFGLIEENGALKIFGAGLLSSAAEMKHALSDSVRRIPFTLERVLETDFDPTQFQSTLFVIPTLESLESALEQF